jgi:hypothetical protein
MFEFHRRSVESQCRGSSFRAAVIPESVPQIEQTVPDPENVDFHLWSGADCPATMDWAAKAAWQWVQSGSNALW